MLPLRQRAHALALLARHLSQPPAGAPAARAAWQLQAAAALHGSCCAAALPQPLTGITKWLAQRMPSALGGVKDGELDIDTWQKSLAQARRLGALNGFVHGTAAASDGSVQGTMRQFEQIVGAMSPEEKADLSLLDGAARRRVAAAVGCSPNTVDDCVARYRWTARMMERVAELRREGRELPQDAEELERQVGSWQDFKSEHATADGGAAPAVPRGHVGARGQPCPLAGAPVGRNTKCPATNKAFKACCGRKLRVA